MLKRDALGRIVHALPLLLGASLLTFLLIHAAPGGPFAAQALNPRAQPGAIALLEARWGLDQPVHVQYLNWLGNILRGDLGYSIRTGQPVLETVGHAIWPPSN